MLKKYISLFFCMFLVFALIGGCEEVARKMIESVDDSNSKIATDVLRMGRPEISKEDSNIISINIDDILKKYIYVGMPEKDAIRFLKRDGFTFLKKDGFIFREKDAQKSVLHAYYLLASSYTATILPPYEIAVRISVVDGKVSEFSGVFR